MSRKPTPPRDLREDWQVAQGQQCGCYGCDDLCVCQNVNPWPAKPIDWQARAHAAEAELASERAHRLVAERNLREAIKECSGWAREAGEARGRLEMSEAAGIVDEWRERAEKAEAERDEAFRLADEAQHAWLDPKPWMERATVAEAELQQVKAERDEARARAEGNWIAGVGMAELAREALVQSDHFKRFMRLYAEAGHNEFMASLPLHDRALSVEAKLAEAVKGLEGLKVCLSEFVDAERRTAENSFCQYNRGKKVWNGKLWRAADPAGYAMVARARRAINGVASIRAPSSEGGEG